MGMAVCELSAEVVARWCQVSWEEDVQVTARVAVVGQANAGGGSPRLRRAAMRY